MPTRLLLGAGRHGPRTTGTTSSASPPPAKQGQRRLLDRGLLLHRQPDQRRVRQRPDQPLAAARADADCRRASGADESRQMPAGSKPLRWQGQACSRLMARSPAKLMKLPAGAAGGGRWATTCAASPISLQRRLGDDTRPINAAPFDAEFPKVQPRHHGGVRRDGRLRRWSRAWKATPGGAQRPLQRLRQHHQPQSLAEAGRRWSSCSSAAPTTPASAHRVSSSSTAPPVKRRSPATSPTRCCAPTATWPVPTSRSARSARTRAKVATRSLKPEDLQAMVGGLRRLAAARTGSASASMCGRSIAPTMIYELTPQQVIANYTTFPGEPGAAAPTAGSTARAATSAPASSTPTATSRVVRT